MLLLLQKRNTIASFQASSSLSFLFFLENFEWNYFLSTPGLWAMIAVHVACEIAIVACSCWVPMTFNLVPLLPSVPGDLFDMLLPMLTIYQEYVRNHHYSLQVLAECKQREKFVAILRRLEEKSTLQGRTLETFLTYPMHQVRPQLQNFLVISQSIIHRILHPVHKKDALVLLHG